MKILKEILFDTLRNVKTDVVPWVPFAGVHAGKLTGADAIAVLTDEETLFNALMEVNKLYKPFGQPVLFDLQVEAEILGCELVWAKDCPPSVKSHPLDEIMEIPDLSKMPKETDGRLPMILRVMRRVKEAIGNETALYGLVCGPFTLASHLRGNDIFMDMYDDEDFVIGLIKYCNEFIKTIAGFYIEAGMDVIAVVDPLVSQISQGHFEEFLSDVYTDFFDFIRVRNVFSSFFVCGDATRNIEVMCKTKPDSICIDENVDIVAAKAVTDKYSIVIGGNIPLTTVMLHGTQQDNMKYVLDLIDKAGGNGNLIIAPGCDMPFDVPIENAVAVSHAVLHPEETHEMLKNYVAAIEDIDVELPDYANLPRALVEVFTLDSATCAACAYMMDAALKAKEAFGDDIDLVEYKFTVKENIARCKKMGIKNLPSIYINGELKFSSIIPGREEFFAIIKEAIK